MEFVESFMKFSFDDKNIFRIEEDELLTEYEGLKTCECVVLINDHIAFIEAKSSSPHPKNTDDFNDFIGDIKQKFADSLRLFTEIKSQKHGEQAFNRLPENIRLNNSESRTYKIFLIIHGHREDWLLGLLDTLREAMRDVVHQWNLRDSNIKVFNEVTALSSKIIVAYIPKTDIASVKQENGNADPEKVEQWFLSH